MSLRQRLCINFSNSKLDFLTTLHSHLEVSGSYYSSSSLWMNVRELGVRGKLEFVVERWNQHYKEMVPDMTDS